MAEKKKILMACCNYWNSPFQVGSHHLARGFANAGWDVAFISAPISPLHFLNGFSEELKDRFFIYKSGGVYDNDSIWSYVPGSLLTPYNKPLLRSEWVLDHWYNLTTPNIIDKLNQAGFGDVDIVYFDTPNQAFWLNNIKYKRAVFRIADKNSGFSNFTPVMKLKERELAQKVDTVIYTAKNLKSYVMDLKPKQILHLGNGVNFKHFAEGSRDIPFEYTNIPRPIALYVGAMDVWFDYNLVNEAAERLPQISFVLIGPEAMAKSKLKELPNIYLLGRKEYKELPAYLYNADVGIIPFDIKNYPELVNSINPLKLYEYMACGLPVVSVAWDELNNLCSPAITCLNTEEFITKISMMNLELKNREQYIQYAAKQDWTTRVFSLLEYLELVN